MNSSFERLDYLDALRGIAAYIVFAGHFFEEGFIKNLPIVNLLTDTKLAVAIFFILSGIVLTRDSLPKTLSIIWLPIQIFARLVRLAIPVFSVSLFVWFLYHFNFLGKGPLPEGYEFWNAYTNLINGDVFFTRVIYFSWVEAFFLYNNVTTLIPPAWTMRPEFFGSIIILLYTWLHQRKIIKTTPLFLILISFILIFTYNFLPVIYYFGFFLTGLALRQLYNKNIQWFRYPVLTLILILAFKTIFQTLGIDSFELDFIFASLIIFSLMEAKSIHKAMSCKLFLWLGKISFPLYLLHVSLISSVGLNIINFLSTINLSSEIGQFVTFIILSIILIFTSLIFLPIEIVSIKISRLIRKIYK